MMHRFFKKKRRRSIKEKKKWLTLWRLVQLIVFLAIIGGSAYAIYHYLIQSERFNIATIRIIGANLLDEQEILLTAGITVADNLVTVDIDEVKQKVEAMPFIKSCEVKRFMPDTIVIEVQERVPVAAVMINNHLYEVGIEGVVLREIDSLARHTGPMITSLPELNFAQPGQAIAQKELHIALKLWQAFVQQPVSKEITVSEIAAKSTEHISMICDEFPFEIRWGYTDVAQQAEKFNTLWQSQNGKFPCQEYLDLRFGTEIPCK